ncbi:MAG: DUF3369 domain-containing protein [Magnetococcales bacterium]|nr:DUF3369 domain-containing protein [Magnetococcales bacterium]
MSFPTLTPDDVPLQFAEEGGEATGPHSPGLSSPTLPPWKILVVDDDEEVLALTRLVLRGFSFEGRPMELFSARSGAEARVLVGRHPDAAIMLLDVVMETESAGLEVVRYIRDELKNAFIRIILRTGQPGHAPENTVLVEYDVNDYKEKSSLSKQNLITSILSALRSYRDLRALENTRRGLQKIIDASADLFEPNSLRALASGILTQLAAILGLESTGGVHSRTSSLAFTRRRGEMLVYAGSGRFEGAVGRPLRAVVSEALLARIEQGVASRKALFFESNYFGYFRSATGIENFLFMEGVQPLGALERDLLEIFSANIAFAFDRLFLTREILDTQRDVTFTLGEVIEVRSQEAGNHVRRVASYSRLLGAGCGLSDSETDLLFMASPLHDLGKIGIPDNILNKPGKLDEIELQVMQGHATIGYNILRRSSRSILKAGAIIAHQHHERWDGGGYPQGIRGEEIHLFARIIAITDVFDALVSNRCYRKAWEPERALALIEGEKGRHFDPGIVAVFFANLDDILEIRESLKD